MSRLATLALVACLAACGGGSEPPSPSGETAAALRLAPAAADVGGRTYRIETYLWRDFMPGPDASANGRPLIAAVTVSATDRSAIPADVRVDAMWVINGNDVWRATPREEQPREDPTRVAVVAREGPRWGPGITVDVVVRLRGANGATALVRAAAQPINRTD